MIAKKRQGFTFPEIVIVVSLVSMIMLTIFAFFSSGVRSTVKGKDRLDSIRAMTLLLADMKKDIANAEKIEAENLPLQIGETEDLFPDDVVYDRKVTFTGKDGIFSYSQGAAAKGESSFVLRSGKNARGEDVYEKFGVPRINSFEVLHVIKKGKFGSLPQDFNQVLIKMVLDSNDPRLPEDKLYFTHVLVPNRLPGSDWSSPAEN